MRKWPWIALIAIIVVALAGLFALEPWDTEEQYFIAVVGPMSGPNASVGEEAFRGAELAVDTLNETTDGTSLEIVVFDDEGDPEIAADIAANIVADNRILAVIGHSSSSTSLAAAPIYQESGLAAISGQATLNELGQFPSYFRTTFNNETEGQLLVQYVRNELGFSNVNLVVGSGIYEQEVSQSFSAAFTAQGGTIGLTWNITSDHRDQSIEGVVEGLRTSPAGSVTLLALTENDGFDTVLAIRRAGLNPGLIGVESMGSENFAERFEDEPEEEDTPGFFTEGMYVASPLIYDSVGGDSLAFASSYDERYGSYPGWRSAKAYDAVLAAQTSISTSDLDGDSSSLDNDRQIVIAALTAINSPETAVRGVSGPLYFSEGGDAPQAFSLGQFRRRRPDFDVVSIPAGD